MASCIRRSPPTRASVVHEGVDARVLDRTRIPEPVGVVVCDASFIGLAKVLPAALALAEPGADLVALVKPQFEVGPQRVGKGGIVAIRKPGRRRWPPCLPGWEARAGPFRTLRKARDRRGRQCRISAVGAPSLGEPADRRRADTKKAARRRAA
jgi:hypothetical protein